MPAHPKKQTQSTTDTDALRAHMGALKLPFMLENHQAFAHSAADKQLSHLDYLTELISGEAAARADRRVQRCINQARFPVLKTLDQFDWNWPTKINRMFIQNLFHLDFVKQHANVVFISGTGLGKSFSHDGTGPCGVSAGALRTVHWRHRDHQHAGRCAGQRQHQTRHAPLQQA